MSVHADADKSSGDKKASLFGMLLGNLHSTGLDDPESSEEKGNFKSHLEQIILDKVG